MLIVVWVRAGAVLPPGVGPIDLIAGPMMRSSTYYRERAKRCRLFAAKSRSQRMANRLLAMALEFEHLAAAHEARGRAQRCRLLAAKSRTQHMSAQLLAMAIEYERLAAIAETRRAQAARDKTRRPDPDS